jgi:hypothetical protein
MQDFAERRGQEENALLRVVLIHFLVGWPTPSLAASKCPDAARGEESDCDLSCH